MSANNIVQQLEELEVLEAIFPDKWKKCERPNEPFSMRINKDVELWIEFNKEYPSHMPPHYELWAPKLSRSQKDLIDEKFKEIYELNRGYPIIFQWIEKLKEIVEASVPAKKNGKNNPKNKFVMDNMINDRLEKRRSNNKTSLAEEKCDREITHGEPITDRKSTFQGHVCRVTDESQVKQMLDTLLENKKISQAKHNILAYRIAKGNLIISDCDDDGENHAGGRLLHLLEILDAKNVAVVVTRWFGGIHLGPDRFKHISNAARQTLVKSGFK
ncbi:protein IMPACT-B-like [Euwallacea fornicatus]|uniref:protein IMPACT-B-like n=1 Tax=Euwallacea fornicatus TaxID=995702 RepID=UPI00339014EF